MSIYSLKDKAIYFEKYGYTETRAMKLKQRAFGNICASPLSCPVTQINTVHMKRKGIYA